jgi:2-pyrone-4,6-dicarboxylate lactonase
MTKPCLPPKRIVTAPRYRPPAGACDCHAHVFGPSAIYPFVDDRSFTPPVCSVEDYLATLDVLGIDRGIIVHGSVHGTDNRISQDAIATAPERLRGVAVIDSTFTPEAIERLHLGGFRGARMSTIVKGGPGFGNLEAIATLVRPVGWHLVAHVSRPDELVTLAPRLLRTGLTIVIDHVASISLKEGPSAPAFAILREMLETDRCWIKISGLSRRSTEGYPWSDARPLVEALLALRPDRILWGSDWPHPNMYDHVPDDAELVDAFALWVPDVQLQRQILVDNPEKLYWCDA